MPGVLDWSGDSQVLGGPFLILERAPVDVPWLLRGAAPRPRKPTAFGSPAVQAGMLGRFRDLTGIELVLP